MSLHAGVRRSRSPSGRSTIHAFQQLWREDDRAGFRIECSSGTYVRSLIADLGDAYTLELRRTRIGPFDVADADPERVIPLAEALGMFRSAVLSGDAARRAVHGVAVAAGGGSARPRAPVGSSPQPPSEVLLLDARRPDRPRRGARGRPAEARRRLPGVKITKLPTRSRARGASPSAPSTACTGATAR